MTVPTGRAATISRPEASPPPVAPRRTAVAWALVAVTVALAGTAAWGAALQRGGTNLTLFAAPFFADWGPRPTWGLVLPIGIALTIATCGPRVARVLRWRRLLVVAWTTTVAWSVALSASTGWAGLTRSVRSRYDYAAALPVVRRVGFGPFVRTYVDHLGGAPTHVKSHPPGMVVLLRGLEVLGLRGSGWAAVALIAVTATVPIGVAVTVRRLGAGAAARAVLPFLVCGPWTLLVATVADGLFAAAVVWGTALLAAASAADRRHAAVLALVSGALLAGSLYLSYGLVPLAAALAAAVLLSTRRYRLIPPLLAGATVVVAAWTLAGFDWFGGFRAARALYHSGAAAHRPYSYFVVADVVVFAVMLGPAVVAASVHRPRRAPAAVARSSSVALDPFAPPLRWLAGAAVAAVAIADLSGLSKGEVERIWLPFVPFATLVVVRLASSRRTAAWIAAQAAAAIGLQTLLIWPW